MYVFNASIFYFFSLSYTRSMFFIFIPYVFFVPSGICYFLSNKYATRDHMSTLHFFHSAILAFGYMEEELSTACRAAADALEILSNLRPGFTRNVIPRMNSTAVSVSQPNNGARKVNNEGAVLVYQYTGEFLLFSYPYMEL